MINIILLASVAGFLSSILGGLIAIFIGNSSKKVTGLSFIFATAMLMALVFIDFLPHAIGHGHYHVGVTAEGVFYQYWYQHSGAGIWLTVLGLAGGVGLVLLLSFFDKYGHEHIHGILPHSDDCSHPNAPKESLTELEKKRMVKTAFLVAFAIILHDFPKGLAIGTAGSVLVAVIIGISCVPEGMSIAIPLKAGGKSNLKILAICGLAGLATVLGAIIGYLIGGISPHISGLMFAVASGAVLAVVFAEIMPMAMQYSERSRLKFPIMLAGVLIVLILNYFFHNLMH